MASSINVKDSGDLDREVEMVVETVAAAAAAAVAESVVVVVGGFYPLLTVVSAFRDVCN